MSAHSPTVNWVREKLLILMVLLQRYKTQITSVASYRSLSGSPGPKFRKKVWKQSRKSAERTFSRLLPHFSDIFETFSRLGPKSESSEGSQITSVFSYWGTKISSFQNSRKLAILLPIRFDTPSGAAKETPKRVPK